MMTTSDLDRLRRLGQSNDKTGTQSQSLSKILKYEQLYQRNSLEILHIQSLDRQIIDWQEEVIKFLILNGNLRKINKISPLVYVGLGEHDSKTSYNLFKQIINNFPNGIIIITNKNQYKEKISKTLDEKGKICIIMTDDESEFQTKNASNVLIVKTDNVEEDFKKMCNFIY